MRLRVRNPTGTEVVYEHSALEIQSIINGWHIRKDIEFETYQKDDEILIIIKRRIS